MPRSESGVLHKPVSLVVGRIAVVHEGHLDLLGRPVAIHFVYTVLEHVRVVMREIMKTGVPLLDMAVVLADIALDTEAALLACALVGVVDVAEMSTHRASELNAVELGFGKTGVLFGA